MIAIALTVILLIVGALSGCKRHDPGIVFHAAPSYRPSILEEFRARFPEPISISPDGRRVLLRTLNSDGNPFGLEVIELASHQRVAEISFTDDPMRICWRPDSSSISFFLQNRQKNGRSLHLWRLSTGRDEIIQTPPAKAEPNMKWSPDSRYFAYIESGVGLVVIDTQKHRILEHIEKGVDYIFEWLDDSRKIAYVTWGQRNIIRIIDITGNAAKVLHLPDDYQLLDVIYSGARKGFVVITRTRTNPFLLETVSLEPFAIQRIYRSDDELDYLHVATNGEFCTVEIVKNAARKINLFNLKSHSDSEIPDPSGGDNQVEIIDPNSQFLVFTHRGSTPPAIYRYDFASMKMSELYSRSFPQSVSAEEYWIPSSDGVKVPLYVWKGAHTQAAPSALIRLHAFKVKETPTWQDEIQIMASHGVTYIACNYRGSLGFGFDYETKATDQNQIEDVLATIEYVHNELKIPYKRIVLFGYSAGADLALRTAIERLPQPGILAIVGAHGRSVSSGVMNRQHHPHVLIFHGTYEEDTLDSIKVVAQELATMSQSDRDVELYELKDNHDFNYPESRAEIYSAILNVLNQ
ncbi:MAG: prolyl oligopeptidase family serine peptidase [Terracidiphilus sp.]